MNAIIKHYSVVALTIALYTITTTIASARTVSYIDSDGLSQNVNAYSLSTVISTVTESSPLTPGWYYVEDTLIVNDDIPLAIVSPSDTASHFVHIIVLNNSCLNVNGRIYRSGSISGGALCFYGQTQEDSIMGRVCVRNNAGIGINVDSLVVTAVNIDVQGNDCAANIQNGSRFTRSIVNIRGTGVGLSCIGDAQIDSSKVNISAGAHGVFVGVGQIKISDSDMECYGGQVGMTGVFGIKLVNSKLKIYTVESGLYGMISPSGKTFIENCEMTAIGGSGFAIGVPSDSLIIRNSIINAENSGTSNGSMTIFAIHTDVEGGEIYSSGNFAAVLSIYGVSAKNAKMDLRGGMFGIFVPGDNSQTPTVDIFDCCFYATGDSIGVYAYDADIRIGWSDVNTRVYASSYKTDNGIVDIQSHCALEDTREVATASNINGETIVPAQFIALTQAGVATFYEGTHDMLLPGNLKAKIATFYTSPNDTTLNYTTIADGTLSDIMNDTIPAGTAVLLFRGDGLSDNTVMALPYSTSLSGWTYPDNLLKGSDVDTLLTRGEDKRYALTVENSSVKWYDVHILDDVFLSYAHRAWLEMPIQWSETLSDDELIIQQISVNAKSARVLMEDVEDVYEEYTEADVVTSDVPKENDAWYDLHGRKYINRPVKSGVYIHNYRKVLIK